MHTQRPVSGSELALPRCVSPACALNFPYFHVNKAPPNQTKQTNKRCRLANACTEPKCTAKEGRRRRRKGAGKGSGRRETARSAKRSDTGSTCNAALPLLASVYGRHSLLSLTLLYAPAVIRRREILPIKARVPCYSSWVVKPNCAHSGVLLNKTSRALYYYR